MKTTIYSLFFILFMGLSACSQKSHHQNNDTVLKVLSYNIHHANPPSEPDLIDLEAIAEVINTSGAELVAIQEVDVRTERSGKSSDQAEELGKLTGMNVFFSKGIDYQGGEYGTAILSKFPLLETERHELPNLEGVNSEPRTLAVVTVEINGQKYKFANTHLDYTNAENNHLQAQKIMEILGGESVPVLMAGDFNAVPESTAIQLLDQKFTRSCTQDCPLTSPQVQPKRIIDYIMVSSDANLNVVEHQVIEETYASDHRPVFAIYELPD